MKNQNTSSNTPKHLGRSLLVPLRTHPPERSGSTGLEGRGKHPPGSLGTALCRGPLFVWYGGRL